MPTHLELMPILKSLAPIGAIPLGWLFAILLETLVVARLRRWAEKTAWEGDDILLAALAGLPKWIGGCIGLHIALESLPLTGAVIAWGQKASLMGGVMVATIFAARVAVGFLKLYTSSVEGVMPSTSIFLSLAKVLVYVLGGLIALQSAGISIAPILTALGVGGLATALALQPTLANLFSGIQILASRTINPGDFVRLDSGEEGHVMDINWRTATIRSPSHSLVLVPNSRLANAVVTNHHYPDREIVVPVNLHVGVGTDLARLEQLVRAVGEAVQTELEGAVDSHRPEVRYTGYTEFGIAFVVGLRAKEPAEQGLLKHEFLRRITLGFRQEGIEIPVPGRTVRNLV